MASIVASELAIYSASSIDRATTDSDLACQRIGPLSIKIQPPIDFLQVVVVPLAQSESVNPCKTNLNTGIGSCFVNRGREV